jgi:hypothetical protein
VKGRKKKGSENGDWEKRRKRVTMRYKDALDLTE